jgi:hypothetical protein
LEEVELHNLYASTSYYQGDQVYEDEMGEARNTHVKDEKYAQNFGSKT